MNQREKLIELLSEHHSGNYAEAQRIADHLLANGVVVLPCKCEECEYHDNFGRYGVYVGADVHYCTKLKFGTRDSEFCPYGERRKRMW